MCGDHDNKSTKVELLEGSPPHVRGPPVKVLDIFHSHGITPACAGTTALWFHLPMIQWDHPRMCGDHPSACPIQRIGSGSPPHVRGPHTLCHMIEVDPGITPACAGTTYSSYNLAVDMGDHPRMCGDH